MRRELAAIVIGIGTGGIFYLLGEILDIIPQWAVIAGLIVSSLVVVGGLAAFFWPSDRVRAVKARIDLSPFTHDDYAGIEVINRANAPIRCYASFIEVIHLRRLSNDAPEERIDITTTIDPYKYRLVWEGGSEDGTKIIEARGDSAIVYIAKLELANGKKTLFALQGGSQIFNGYDFIVHVRIGGYRGNRPIKPISFRRIIRRRVSEEWSERVKSRAFALSGPAWEFTEE